MRIGVILDATSLRGSKAATAASVPETPASGITLVQIYKAVESESAVTDTDMFNLKE
jgi:hypothetical protein